LRALRQDENFSHVGQFELWFKALKEEPQDRQGRAKTDLTNNSYLEAFRFFNLGFWEKPLHPTVPDFSQAPRHPQSAVHLLLEHIVALDLFSTRISFCSSVHSSYSFHCCPQVLSRLMTLAFNLGLTLPLVPRLFACAHFRRVCNPSKVLMPACAARSSHHIFPSLPRRFI
jgi:hypothetical protein